MKAQEAAVAAQGGRKTRGPRAREEDTKCKREPSTQKKIPLNYERQIESRTNERLEVVRGATGAGT